MMIRSQKLVTSKHVDLPFNQCNLIVGIIRAIERGKNGFISLIKRSIIQAFVYFHLIYNVCYHSMAKTEDLNQDASQDKLVKTLVYENPNEINGFVVKAEDVPNTPKINCQHVSKAVDANSVRNAVKHAGGFALLRCKNCKKSESVESKDLSLCLRCGACNCQDHVLTHFEVPHSDPHTLIARIKDWSVWCYKCNIEVSIESSGKLKDGINILKTTLQKPSKNLLKTNRLEPEIVDRNMESNAHCSRNANYSSLSVNIVGSLQLPTPRGLVNLGNTCFMNSVLQCLAQTPFLLEMLQELAEPGKKVTLEINENEHLNMELSEWGSLTEILASTLRHMTSGSDSVYSPNQLLDALRKKYRQFIGYNQHDAHELLRQLLDSVKSEDIKRYQTHILHYFGLSTKTNPRDMDEKKKPLAKSVNQRLTELVSIMPDPIFKGTLVSTVRCTKCFHKSEVEESFLDLSLPVTFEKAQPPILTRRKNVDNFEDRPKSKHQKKKEMKANRKMNKLAKCKKILKDEDVKEVGVKEKKDVSESGYSSGKASSPVQNHNVQIPVESSGNDILAEALTEIDSSSSSSPIHNTNSINEENGSKMSDKIETNREDFVMASSSSMNFNNSVLEDKTENDNISDDVNDASPVMFSVENFVEPYNTNEPDQFVPEIPDTRCRLVNSPSARCDFSSSGGSSDDKDEDDNFDNNDDDDDAVDGDDDGSAEEEVDDGMAEDDTVNATLKSRSDYNDSSIYSCLSQFTAVEILTGNNKVKCDACTDRHNKDVTENEKKKPVYQTATKQLLIKSPPPVLILHLKRFQAWYTSLRKVSKTVTFPFILDIAPFCLAKCQNLLLPDQNKILYALYGVVVHSGSLQGGHYIAYVKVRKPVEPNSYRRMFLPKNSHSFHIENINRDTVEQKLEEYQVNNYAWYCISDSHVAPVSAEQVLMREAYLLFYERIF